MKKYEYTLSTRLPQSIADTMSSICESVGVNESDFVRKSLVAEIQRFESADERTTNKFEYV